MYIFVIFNYIFPNFQIIVMPHLILSRLFQCPSKGLYDNPTNKTEVCDFSWLIARGLAFASVRQ